MLTPQDIQNIMVAGREVFATKQDIGILEQMLAGVDKKVDGLEQRLVERIDILTNAVDAYMKKADAYFQEMAVLLHKVQRMEAWIQLVAEKVGIKYV